MLEQLVEAWQINHRITQKLTLKQTGNSVEELKWGLWDWNKI